MAVLFLLSNPHTFDVIFFFNYAGLDCQYNIKKKKKDILVLILGEMCISSLSMRSFVLFLFVLFLAFCHF